jgi:hypothetical protein
MFARNLLVDNADIAGMISASKIIIKIGPYNMKGSTMPKGEVYVAAWTYRPIIIDCLSRGNSSSDFPSLPTIKSLP